MLYDGVIFSFNFLDSIIVLNGVSLLDICIAVVLIGTFLPMIIGLASTGVRASSKYRDFKVREAKNSERRNRE